MAKVNECVNTPTTWAYTKKDRDSDNNKDPKGVWPMLKKMGWQKVWYDGEFVKAKRKRYGDRVKAKHIPAKVFTYYAPWVFYSETIKYMCITDTGEGHIPRVDEDEFEDLSAVFKFISRNGLSTVKRHVVAKRGDPNYEVCNDVLGWFREFGPLLFSKPTPPPRGIENDFYKDYLRLYKAAVFSRMDFRVCNEVWQVLKGSVTDMWIEFPIFPTNKNGEPEPCVMVYTQNMDDELQQLKGLSIKSAEEFKERFQSMDYGKRYFIGDKALLDYVDVKFGTFLTGGQTHLASRLHGLAVAAKKVSYDTYVKLLDEEKQRWKDLLKLPLEPECAPTPPLKTPPPLQTPAPPPPPPLLLMAKSTSASLRGARNHEGSTDEESVANTAAVAEPYQYSPASNTTEKNDEVDDDVRGEGEEDVEEDEDDDRPVLTLIREYDDAVKRGCPPSYYLFSEVLPLLHKLGWQSLCDKRENYTVHLAPWAAKPVSEGGLILDRRQDQCDTGANASVMLRDRDYFVDQQKVLEYLRKHGLVQASAEAISPPTAETCGRRRRQKAPAVPDAPPCAAKKKQQHEKLKTSAEGPPSKKQKTKTPAVGPPSKKQKIVTDACSPVPTPALGPGGTELDDDGGVSAPSDDFPETGADSEPHSVKAAAFAPLPTYRQLIREARVLLAPGQLPEPLGREDKTAELKAAIVGALRMLGAGRPVSKGSAPPLNDLQNLYVCGGPGMGKTLCVEKVLRELVDEHGGTDSCVGADSPGEGDGVSSSSSSSSSAPSASAGEKRPRASSTPVPPKRLRAASSSDGGSEEVLPPFEVLRMRGTELTASDFYSTIARRLQLEVGPGGEASARLAVLTRFTNEAARRRWESGRGGSKSAAAVPITVLFIDEIDRAPHKAVAELLEILKDATARAPASGDAPAPWACTLVVVGLANTFSFPEDAGISVAAQEVINTVVFQPYNADQLKAIIRARGKGLFDKQSIDLLAMKVAASTGDVRMLLQFADRCLTDTVAHHQRELALHAPAMPAVPAVSSSSSSSVAPVPTAAAVAAPVYPRGVVEANPMARIDEPLAGEVVPLIMTKQMATMFRDMGIGPMRETLFVERLSDGARALLVAMFAYGAADGPSVTVSNQSISSSTLLGPQPLTVTQMRLAFNTYKDLKRCIGHDASEDNMRRWTEELHCSALIEGGDSTFGGNRSFTGGRRIDPDKIKYRLRIAAANVLRYKDLEVTHRNTMQAWMNEQTRQREMVARGDV